MSLLSPHQRRALPSPSAGLWPGLFTPPRGRAHAAIAKAVVRSAIAKLPVTLTFPDGTRWGAGGPELHLARPGNFFARLGRDGLIGLGEAWMTGDLTAGAWHYTPRQAAANVRGRIAQLGSGHPLTPIAHLGPIANAATDQLAAALTVLAGRMDALVPKPLQHLRRLWERRTPADEENTVDGAQENIHRHYDLSNRLFELFLDPTLSYSAALYEPNGPTDLQQAQFRKIDSVLDFADVKPGTRLLEIGSGWGGLAMRAAAERGALVTTLTLSTEQKTLADKRIAQAGLTDRIEVRLEDYRTHAAHNPASYQAVVSVEMIEAVGERYWPDYFAAVDRVLTPGGRMGLQAITIPHERLRATSGSYTWIHKYIFPGGILPSLESINNSVAPTRLRVDRSRRLGPSYAVTLEQWRHTFNTNIEQVFDAGFDETFARMWNFYLAYTQAGFAAEYIDDWQLGLASTS